ncbi:hypothetical protein CWQ_00585 [Buchnera aphidicola str. TLW03 (Acyrthosiphon pisum)]|nr:hypothetical protein CWQ_00585 [Buchnera aphidicola str. TLW03 (Acyrthosiphon pisum)]
MFTGIINGTATIVYIEKKKKNIDIQLNFHQIYLKI